MQHLQNKLPLDVPFVKHAECLHPEKRFLPGAVSTISNLTVSVYSVHKNCLQDVLSINSPVIYEEIVGTKPMVTVTE